MRMNQLADPIFKKPAPGANADLFGSNLQPKEGGFVRMLIVISLATASVVNMMVRKGSVTVTTAINGGNAIPAGKVQFLEMLVHSDHAYNFQLATDSAVDLLYVATEAE